MLGLYRFLSPACIVLVIIALIVVAPAASAEPLQPTGKWHLFYQESNCSAERAFGDHMLGIQPSPLGKTMRLVIVGPGRILRTRQLDSLIGLSDGGPPSRRAASFTQHRRRACAASPRCFPSLKLSAWPNPHGCVSRLSARHRGASGQYLLMSQFSQLSSQLVRRRLCPVSSASA